MNKLSFKNKSYVTFCLFNIFLSIGLIFLGHTVNTIRMYADPTVHHISVFSSKCEPNFYNQYVVNVNDKEVYVHNSIYVYDDYLEYLSIALNICPELVDDFYNDGGSIHIIRSDQLEAFRLADMTYINGIFIDETNSIYVSSSCENVAETLCHELGHYFDKKCDYVSSGREWTKIAADCAPYAYNAMIQLIYSGGQFSNEYAEYIYSDVEFFADQFSSFIYPEYSDLRDKVNNHNCKEAQMYIKELYQSYYD